MAQPTTSRRLTQCFCAIFWCVLSGGPIFGFAALKPILITEGVYESACKIPVNGTSTALEPIFTILDDAIVSKCTDQDLKLNMMFTVAAMLTNVSALVIGRTLDVYGPKVCGLIGAFFLYLASFIFIYADFFQNYIDPYLVGYACLALGGPFAFISSFQLSNSFPKQSGIILALITGAFDASSAVFLLYKMIYNKTEGSFTIAKFFKLYLLVPLFITIAQVFVMPWDSYKTDSADFTHDISEETHLLAPPIVSTRRDLIGDAIKQPYADEGVELLVAHTGGIFGILHGFSAQFQLKTWWFGLICIFASIQMLRLNYFVATIGTQYTYLFGSTNEAEQLNKFFDIALPLGGLISIPFIGYLLDNFSTVWVLSSVVFISLSIGVSGLLSSWIAGIINVSLFVAYRPLFYTVVSDVCAKVFGFETFGTIYGTIMSIAGLVNFGQSYLDQWTHTSFSMNPRPINAVLVTVGSLVGSGLVVYVHHQGAVYKKKKLGLV